MDFVRAARTPVPRACATEAGLSPAASSRVHAQLVALLREPPAGRGPARPPSRDPRRRRRPADHHLRPAAHRHDAPAQPHVRRPGAALAPVLGEPRAGEGRPARRSRRPRSPGTELALEVVNTALPLLQAHARDDARPRARGDPAPRHRLLVDALRDDGADADVARLLPRHRPDARTTRYLQARCSRCCQWLRGGDRWVLKSPQHLEQFPAAGRHVPRRHLRRHPPRPGRGHRVARRR